MPQNKDTKNDSSMDFDSENPGDKGTQKLIITALIAFLVGISVGFALSGESSEPTQNNQAPATTTQATTTSDVGQDDLTQTATTTIALSDQPAGDTVTVDSATIDRVGWAAVYDQVDGEPGNILGARLIPEAGQWSGEVPLLRSTEPNQTYYLKLLDDDGDNEFNHEEDLPIVDDEGNDIQTEFETMPASPRG